MTCYEGWTSCNGVSLLILLILGVALNAVPLIFSLTEEDRFPQNPVSCFEWWFPGIIGAGVMVIPATIMSLAARKRACCNNSVGMFLSSLFSIITVIGAVYCIWVSFLALLEGPLVCNSQGNSTANCQFSFTNLSDIHRESFELQWFLNNSCVIEILSSFNNPTSSDITAQHTIIHFSVFLGLLLVGILEVLFGLSQIIIGFLGCLCGVSKRSRVV
ncbi:PREDICTED: transmembrane 4 L6 family member 20 [Propithecus coquereli]|uniref:Transmembrane 4 L six family member 20 n=1 Tax=Propithecus coquereli TaxID=379532 RepID=A0A2K6FLD2_PROCO|nr:PREDICTED: transmembrane 4 L6 family member 20 [Propithecus coquereli]